jgi:hypothetical protein
MSEKTYKSLKCKENHYQTTALQINDDLQQSPLLMGTEENVNECKEIHRQT